MPTFSRAKLDQALPAPGYYAGLARDISMQHSGPDGTTEIWRVPLFDPDGKLIVTATPRSDEKSEWALINLVRRSGVRMPDGDANIVVRPSDFEGLLIYFSITHSKAKHNDRTFVNVIFQRREWAVKQNPALATAEALFPSARKPGVYAVESAPARSPMTSVPQTCSSSDAAGEVLPPDNVSGGVVSAETAADATSRCEPGTRPLQPSSFRWKENAAGKRREEEEETAVAPLTATAGEMAALVAAMKKGDQLCL